MNIIMETPRLYLRQFSSSNSDAELILELNSDKEVLQYIHEPMLEDLQHSKEILENIILPQYQHNLGRWAVHLKENDEFIGWCGLKYVKEKEEIDLGYRFKKIFWGQGYATEAARNSLDFGFRQLQLKIITGRAHIENIASWKILEKIGMHFTRQEIVDHCLVKTYTLQNPY